MLNNNNKKIVRNVSWILYETEIIVEKINKYE